MNEKEKLIPQRRFKEFKNTGTWEQRKLKEVANHRGGTAIEKYFSKNGKYKVISIGSYGLNSKYIDQGIRAVSNDITDVRVVRKGELTMVLNDKTSNGTIIGRSLLIDTDNEYVINQRTEILSPKENFDSSFAYITLNGPFREKVRKIVQGGTQIYVNYPVVENLKLELPDLEEQKKIGTFFKHLEDTIALHQRKLEKTKALKSAYLSELFPVEGERKPKRRFAGFTDDWKQGTVGEYGYFYYGKSAPKWSVTKDAIIPCVRYGELYTKFGAKIDKVYSYTNISKENLKFSTGNEVLVPRVGEDPLDFANCSWLSIPNVAIGEMISVYNTEENPLFISYYFNSQLRHAFAKRVEGGNVSNLYFTYLENITISIPNKEEQDTIANFLESLDSVVEYHQHKLEKLKNIKQAYLNELFV